MSRDMPVLPRGRKPCDLPTPNSSKSFWHSKPSPLLSGHRSTRTLPSQADVVIIGSGITGASVAHHLLQETERRGGHGLSVIMLEAREACWGATGRNGGHCQPLLTEHPDDPTIGHFELANFSALQNLIRDHSIDCEFVAQPGVRAIYSQKHLQEARDAIATLECNGSELARLMRIVTDRGALAEFRIPSAVGAVVTSVAARLWPYKLVARILADLLTATELAGGKFNLQTHTPVTGLEQGERWTVKTARGSISAQNVVLATNAYTSHLLPSFSDLIVPCRGQMSALYPTTSLSGRSRLQTSLGFLGDGLDDYLVQRPSGHMMFGGGRQHGPSVGVTDDSEVDEDTASYLRHRLVEALGLRDIDPGSGKPVKELEASHQWTGIMGFSRDERPWVGAVPDEDGLFVAAGFTGHGMPNTFLSGKAVAIMVRRSADGATRQAASDAAVEATGLPRAYLLTSARVQKSLALDDVEVADHLPMSQSREGDERPHSGYA